MQKLFKTRLFIQVAIATLVATLATVGIVAATTTIGTSINTGGTLTVTSTTATSTISTGGLTVGTNQFVVQQTSGNVGIGTSNPSSKLDIKGDLDVASVGSDLSPDSTGAACAANGDCVTKSVSVVSGVSYIVQWDQTHSLANNGKITPKIGAVSGIAQMWGDTSAHTSQQQVITAGATGAVNLVFTVSSYTSETITLANISLKALTSSNAVAQFLNSDGTEGISMRPGNSGYGNAFVGGYAGLNNYHTTGNTGTYNTAFGYTAMHFNTTGYFNTGIGSEVLYNNTTGYFNTGIGMDALYTNITGTSNTAIGHQSLLSNTTGYDNTATGDNAMQGNTTGYYNTANGKNTLVSNTTGNSNSGFGLQALRYNTTGSSNTAVGFGAGNGISGQAAFNNSTMLGYKAGYSLTTGSSNTLFGYQSGYSLAAGSNNIIIGQNVDATSTTATGQLNIGNVLFGTGMYSGAIVSGAPVSGGMIGIGTSTPTTQLQVANSTANATSTLTVGKASQNKGSCLELFDSAGTAVYAYVAAGGTTFTLSAVSCK